MIPGWGTKIPHASWHSRIIIIIIIIISKKKKYIYIYKRSRDFLGVVKIPHFQCKDAEDRGRIGVQPLAGQLRSYMLSSVAKK